MKSLLSAYGLVALLLATSQVAAQETPQVPPPQKEHEWLKQFVGEWVSESEVKFSPDQPAAKCQGTMKSQMLGGFWLMNEATVDMLGDEVHAVQSIGYDPEKKKYVGTWVDSMSSHMWKYEGTVDDTGKILTLEAEGPSFAGDGKMAKYRDSYEFKSKDHIVATSSVLGEDGKWITFITGDVRRKQ